MTPDELVDLINRDPFRLPVKDEHEDNARRVANGHPCVGCGARSNAAYVVTPYGHGIRWVDLCGPCDAAWCARMDDMRAAMAVTSNNTT